MKAHIDEFLKQQKSVSDRFMNYFLFTFYITGIFLSSYYDTWLIGIGVGSLLLIAYYSAKKLLPQSNLYQYIMGAITGIFMAQYIYQMHGMFEMHFFAFIGSAILITYRNWKLQIPLAIVVILHHAVFGYLQFMGFDRLYFTQLEYMSMQAFIIHILLATSIFTLCGIWAYNFKRSDINIIKKSFAIGKLREAYSQKEELIALSNDLKASNQRLENASRELSIIFNTIDEVLFSVDLVRYRVTQMSVACQEIYGYAPIEFIADSELWKKIIHPEDKHLLEKNDEHYAKGETVINRYRIIHKNKTVKWIEAKIIPTLNQGQLVRIDGICKDITDKVKLESRLKEEQRQRQHQITAAVITAQENERMFLGEELHDNINPILATAKLYIDVALAAEEKRTDILNDSKGFINSAMNEVRTLSKSLVPPSLGEIGLKDAVSDMLYNITRVHDLHFKTSWKTLDENILSGNLKLSIYRIIQEQLNNIMKYAQAKNVYICIKQNENWIELIIKDDGVGFDPAQKRNGVGIQNIISRTELYNGKALINAAPGRGCELVLNFDTHTQLNALKMSA